MEKDIQKEVERFFKEKGLEEEVKKLTDLFTDRYTIRGEVTEDLREALHRAPDQLIDMIWRSVKDKEPDEGLNRQQKEEGLYEDIPGYFESRFDMLEIGQLHLLLRIMNYEPIDTVEAINVINAFVPYGWVFYFVENDNGSFAVTKEVGDILRTLEKPEIQERIGFYCLIRYVVKTCLALYGVCTLKQICDILVQWAEDGNKMEELIGDMSEVVQEYLPYLEEQGILWLDGEYIIDPFLQTKKEYRGLLRRQSQKYYMPDQEMVIACGSGNMVDKNEEYKTVFSLLLKETKDRDETEEILEELAVYVTREDSSASQLMNCLYEWDVAFENDRAAARLFRAMGEWTYSIRRWSECGYSRKELHKENADLKYMTNSDKYQKVQEIEKKVYPNDPCPCGSGKKYKKCCGKL